MILKGATHEEIYDAALAHIRKQGCPSINGAGCVYRDGKGNACAVGGLFPDSHYKPEFDKACSTSVASLLSFLCPHREDMRKALQAGGIDPDDKRAIELLRSLQDAHDSAGLRRSGDFMVTYEDNMRRVADCFSLTYEPGEK
nr:hypothetical protein WG33_0136 [uncultured bacterium]